MSLMNHEYTKSEIEQINKVIAPFRKNSQEYCISDESKILQSDEYDKRTMIYLIRGWILSYCMGDLSPENNENPIKSHKDI